MGPLYTPVVVCGATASWSSSNTTETYVSAYGHNRRLLVREGQQVKVGQSIAEMGSTGTDRVKLHFEIRRQGKPVDPLQYLPRR